MGREGGERAGGAAWAPAGIVATRRGAEAALRRMLARARRLQLPLAAVRIGPGRDASPAAEAAQRAFLEELAGGLRRVDLAWAEAGGEVVVVLEGARGERAALERLQRRALALGARPAWRAARVAEPTLEALLAAVGRRG